MDQNDTEKTNLNKVIIVIVNSVAADKLYMASTFTDITKTLKVLKTQQVRKN